MLLLKALSFFILLSVAKSDVPDNESECKDNYVFVKKNTDIASVTNYCINKLCVSKCCPDGEILLPKGTCKNLSKLQKEFNIPKTNYSHIPLYMWNEAASKKSKKNFEEHFVFVHNQKLSKSTCAYEHPENERFYILEDATAKMEQINSLERWIDIKKLDFCVEFRIFKGKNKSLDLRIVYREPYDDPGEEEQKSQFAAVGAMISCFFLFLVFVVYCLLRKLRTIGGLVLMGYILSLFVTYLIKFFLEVTETFTSSDCKIISPVFYFFFMSSFFWINIMSFDVWWTLRGHRKSRDIHRRGELVKFMWYCLYAWGSPLLMTIVATVLDNIDLTNYPGIIKPPFDDCMFDNERVFVYYNAPVGVITLVNIVLFLMTVYNIWLIKRALNKLHDSTNTSETNTNRYIVYVKLMVIMGVSWCFELIPEVPLWCHVLIHLYNSLTGAAIFFLFIFKTEVLIMLFDRFGVNNNFANKLRNSMRQSRNGTTRTTGTSTKSCRSQDQEETNSFITKNMSETNTDSKINSI